MDRDHVLLCRLLQFLLDDVCSTEISIYYFQLLQGSHRE